jgi:hypothetical protein
MPPSRDEHEHDAGLGGDVLTSNSELRRDVEGLVGPLVGSGVLLVEALPEWAIQPHVSSHCPSKSCRDVEGLVGPLVDSGVLLVEALPECGADACDVDAREDMIQFVRQVSY